MLSYELKEQTLAYVEGRMGLAELEEWLVPRLPLFMSPGPSPDADLAATIELGLAELSAGITTEKELRRTLAALLNSEPTVIAFSSMGTGGSPTWTETRASNSTAELRPIIAVDVPIFTTVMSL